MKKRSPPLLFSLRENNSHSLPENLGKGNMQANGVRKSGWGGEKSRRAIRLYIRTRDVEGAVPYK